MAILLITILLIGLVVIIGNQYAGIRRMEWIQRSLDDLNQKIREMNSKD